MTGATSFIGAVTVRQLLLKGHQVQAVVRPGSKRLKALKDHVPKEVCSQVQITELEMERIEEIQNRDSASADAWIHTCWEGAGSDNRTLRDVQQSNVESSLKAVRAAFGMGCRRFLFTGSQAEYGICSRLITEDMPLPWIIFMEEYSAYTDRGITRGPWCSPALRPGAGEER